MSAPLVADNFTDARDGKLMAVQVRLPLALYHALNRVAKNNDRSRSGQLAVFAKEGLARLGLGDSGSVTSQ